MQWLSKTAQGFLAPLAAAMGGVASQEVLKAVTGKFSPLQQWVRLALWDMDVLNVCGCCMSNITSTTFIIGAKEAPKGLRLVSCVQ